MKQTKEFYFLRHGETDFNSQPNIKLTHHPREISLNPKGRDQAFAISSIVQELNINSVYTSPLNRVQEMYHILFPEKNKQQTILNEFEECDLHTWNRMVEFNISEPKVAKFINQIEQGLQIILSSSSPTLVIAHGGTHWAICYLLKIKKYNWLIDNCQLVQFCLGDNAEWAANVRIGVSKSI